MVIFKLSTYNTAKYFAPGVAIVTRQETGPEFYLIFKI